MSLKKANRSTLSEQVISQIESLIESGTWPVGSKIPAEPELVQQLDVSRNTVREAVRALVHAGLLVPRPGDGTYVNSSSVLEAVFLRRLHRSNIIEILEVRNALEQEAARLAANRRTPQDITELKGLLEELDNAKEKDDFEAYLSHDIRYHKRIVASSHNQMLIDLYHYMTESVQTSIRGMLDHTDLKACHNQLYHELVTAISVGDCEKAAETVRTYIKESQQILEAER